MKKRVLRDLKAGFDCSPDKPSRLILRGEKIVRVPLKKFFKNSSLAAIFLLFVLGSVWAPTNTDFPFGGLDVLSAAQNDDERKNLENQLSQLEKEISEHEEQIAQYKKQGTTLQSEIKTLEAKIAKLNLQIRSITLNLTKLDSEIAQTENKISGTEADIGANKKILAQLLQTLHENDQRGLIEILLKNPQLSDFFGDVNSLVAVQDNLRSVLKSIINLREELVDQKEMLALEREDVSALKAYQDAQKLGIQRTRNEKSDILKITKGKELEFQKLVKEKKKTAAEIRKQIFKLLGGGELEFASAYDLAKFAGQATGVRPALILAVLDRESALGRNVGQCDYKKAMHPTRDLPIFLQIIKELGMESDLEKGIIRVSCPNRDGLYGGAMGPAQFIPSTWNLYKDKVSEITGSHPPSPWRNADAFVATALYLKDAGAANATLNQERQAAAKYYAGNRWRIHLWTYGDRVVTLAQEFEEDIAILGT